MKWVLLLLLISCAAPGGPTGDEAIFNPLSLYTGTGNLDIELVKSTDELYVYDGFTDTFKVENMMPYDIYDLTISLYGIDQRYWDFNPYSENIYRIYGRNEDNGWIPGRELFSFDLTNRDMPQMYNSKSYEYGYALDFSSNTIFADADVCLGTVQYFTNDASTLSEACTVDTSISYSGQGSMVNVAGIDLDTKVHTAGELTISGTLKNSGGGDILLIHNLKGKAGTQDLACYFLDKQRSPTNIWDPTTHEELKFVCDPILFNSQPFYTNVGFDFDYIYRLVKHTSVKVIR